MSKTGQAMDARQIKARASDWVAERHVPENWNAEEQAKLDAWLEESPAHLIAYLRLDAAWNRTERLAALRRPATEAPTGEKARRASPVLMRAAMAFVCVAAVGAGAVFLLRLPGEKIYRTPVGGHEMVTLADGSQIELNTDTIVRVAENNRGRAVSLDKGEAYFQVRHDAARPFTVTAAGHRLMDLGTKFLVRNDPDHLEVALVEGRVRFQAANDQSRSVVLASGDVAVATADSVTVTKTSPQNLQNDLGWRRGVLAFKHTSLESAAAEFNRYNREKLVVADAASARLTINGTFRTVDVDAFVDVAQDILRLRVERHGDVTVISR